MAFGWAMCGGRCAETTRSEGGGQPRRRSSSAVSYATAAPRECPKKMHCAAHSGGGEAGEASFDFVSRC